MFTVMSYFKPEKLHVVYSDGEDLDILSRKYTLTHSDFSGDLFLTIGKDYDYKKVKQVYVRFMRDEVLAEWKNKEAKYELHIYVHISGGCICGGAGFRDKIIRSHLPLVFDIFRFVEKKQLQTDSSLQDAEFVIHFNSRRKKYDKTERIRILNQI